VAFSDVLYGPRLIQRAPELIILRSLTIDPELVEELVREIQRGVEMPQSIQVLAQGLEDPTGMPSSTEIVDPALIGDLPDWQRERLMIQDQYSQIYVDLRRGMEPSIGCDAAHSDLAHRIALILLAEGRPRILWKRPLRWIPWILAAVMLFAQAKVIADGTSWGTGVTGILFCLWGVFVAWLASQRIGAFSRPGWPGHRIRGISRAALRSQRADRHRDLVVGVSVAFVTAALTGLVSVVIARR
jgi:hypothetical protein